MTPSMTVDQRSDRVKLLAQMAGTRSIHRNLKAEDCELAHYNRVMNGNLTGEQSNCQSAADDDMMVAGDVSHVTNIQPQTGMPDWLKWLLAILAVLGTVLFLAMLALIAVILILNALEPTEPPQVPSVRFYRPPTIQ